MLQNWSVVYNLIRSPVDVANILWNCIVIKLWSWSIICETGQETCESGQRPVELANIPAELANILAIILCGTASDM
jgi:hypothetical protein